MPDRFNRRLSPDELAKHVAAKLATPDAGSAGTWDKITTFLRKLAPGVSIMIAVALGVTALYGGLTWLTGRQADPEVLVLSDRAAADDPAQSIVEVAPEPDNQDFEFGGLLSWPAVIVTSSTPAAPADSSTTSVVVTSTSAQLKTTTTSPASTSPTTPGTTSTTTSGTTSTSTQPTTTSTTAPSTTTTTTPPTTTTTMGSTTTTCGNNGGGKGNCGP